MDERLPKREIFQGLRAGHLSVLVNRATMAAEVVRSRLQLSVQDKGEEVLLLTVGWRC